MAEMHDETSPQPPRRARARRRQPAAAPRQVVSLYAALEAASAEAQSMGHPLSLRRSGEGKFVATCSRCGMDLPVLDTARGWTYPSFRACPNPVRAES